MKSEHDVVQTEQKRAAPTFPWRPGFVLFPLTLFFIFFCIGINHLLNNLF